MQLWVLCDSWRLQQRTWHRHSTAYEEKLWYRYVTAIFKRNRLILSHFFILSDPSCPSFARLLSWTLQSTRSPPNSGPNSCRSALSFTELPDGNPVDPTPNSADLLSILARKFITELFRPLHKHYYPSNKHKGSLNYARGKLQALISKRRKSGDLDTLGSPSISSGLRN